MKLALLTISLAAMLSAIQAACPNACSGHGSCGQYDMCECHTNWEGGDCGNRVCPYHYSWVSSSNGDINFDGDRYDGTEYNTDYPISQNDAQGRLTTQRAPGGTWENWPYFGVSGEGHFYMECSNRGLCSRESGQCECFTGYEGVACRRSVCPMDCSGHGTCETISEMVASDKGNVAYNFWDAEMQRTCLCDSGYAGTACQERLCPYGDDPLTTDQFDDIHWVDVYANAAFAGQVAFEYTDYYGEVWESTYFSTSHSEPTSIANTADYETAAQSALENIPNNVLSASGVTVERGYCEKLLLGNFKTDGAGSFAAATTDATSVTLVAGDVVRCPDASNEPLLMTSASAYTDLGGNAVSESAEDDIKCYKIGGDATTPGFCTRYKVTLPSKSTAFSAKIDKVTVGGKTDAQDSSTDIDASSGTKLDIGDTDLVASHVDPSTVDESCLSAQITITGKTITCASGADYTTFKAEDQVQLTCGSTSRGTYTVDSTTTTDLVLEETPPSCSDDIDILLVSDYITIAGNLEDVDAGSRIYVNGWNTIDGYATKFVKDSALSTRVFLSKPHLSAAGGSESDSTGDVQFNGAGTKEANECGDRGICQRETGICECFKGYSGDSCHSQNTLVA